jgi:hypothetical protein
MIIHNEDAATYHDRPAVSASLLWDIVAPDGCLAQARYNSAWLNPDFVPPRDEAMENGTLVHLAALENHLLQDRVCIIDAFDWRTKEARRLREDAYANGLVPILNEREPGARGPSFQKILQIRKVLEESEAAPLLFGAGGESEVSFTWTATVPFSTAPPRPSDMRVPCKARADRITAAGAIVDLKTAPSASPRGFQQSMVSWGHHLRAAYYLDGWAQQPSEPPFAFDYLFVVVAKEPPHLVSVFRIDPRSLEWGRRLYRSALAQFKVAYEADRWPGYMREPVATIGLPTFAEHHLADLEAQGEL